MPGKKQKDSKKRSKDDVEEQDEHTPVEKETPSK